MNRIILSIALITGITALSLVLFKQFSDPEIVYIELQKVYEDFQMKKELQSELEKINSLKQNQIDSLRLELEMMSRSIKNKNEVNESFELKKRTYLLKEQQTKENLEIVSNEYNERIWKQLNQYISDYGKEKNLKFLLGASGSGTVMYADENANVTKEVSVYVNSKYSGKNKK